MASHKESGDRTFQNLANHGIILTAKLQHSRFTATHFCSNIIFLYKGGYKQKKGDISGRQLSRKHYGGEVCVLVHFVHMAHPPTGIASLLAQDEERSLRRHPSPLKGT